jgi:hypothetical protein
LKNKSIQPLRDIAAKTTIQSQPDIGTTATTSNNHHWRITNRDEEEDGPARETNLFCKFIAA